jgi:TetR/AcrR family transcriptional regulator
VTAHSLYFVDVMLHTFRKLPKERQNAILDAAARAFAQNGYYRANVADICKRARISNGALYKYFKNKRDVFNSVFDRTVRLFSIDPGRFFSTNKSVYQKLRDLLNAITRLAEIHPEYITVYFDLGSPSMSGMAASLSERIEQPAKAIWLSLVEEGKRRGEIDKKVDSNVAAYIIDDYVMLFMFSCVADHYNRRFSSYFGKRKRTLTNREKMRIVLASLKMVLSQKN